MIDLFATVMHVPQIVCVCYLCMKHWQVETTSDITFVSYDYNKVLKIQ
jgi:hypothetical protein